MFVVKKSKIIVIDRHIKEEYDDSIALNLISQPFQ